MKIVTLNLNGLRSALRKGLESWIEREQPDILLFQEVRAPAMPEVFSAMGYHTAWNPALKAGYSGVAMASRQPLEDVQYGIGHALDKEGRVISASISGIRFVSVYLPSGSSGQARQDCKDEMLSAYQAWVDALPRPLVIGGDYNIAHQNIDLKNWRGNMKNSGFLPHEREWMTKHLAVDLIDTHRACLGETAAYTWWSNRGQAYANDVGWRIDYLLAAGVSLTNVMADRDARLSDHAPVQGTLELANLSRSCVLD